MISEILLNREYRKEWHWGSLASHLIESLGTGCAASILPESVTSESWKWQLILTADPAGQEQKARALRWLYPSSPEYIIYSTRTSDAWEIFIFVFLLQNSNT